jgi:hypothetical protein
VSTVLACSSSSSTPAVEEKPAPPAWEGAPTTIDVYDGRLATVQIAVRAIEPSKLVVTATSSTEIELTPAEAPGADGLWHGTLHIRPGYALTADTAPPVVVDMVDAMGQHVVTTVPLQVHKLGWQKRVTWETSKGPQTREHGAFLYDADGRAAYLLQGSGYSPQFKPIEDSWRLDLATGTWAPWALTGDVPAAGGSRRVAQIPGTKKFYVYGGYVGYEATAKDDGDLYLVDLGDTAHTFTRLKNVGNGGQAVGSARELHTIAYDAATDQLVVFGGITTKPSQDALDDTWLVKVAGDTATWTQLKTPKAPSPRYGSFTAFDSTSRRLVVWSGAQLPDVESDPVNAAQDAWALDLAATPPKWSKLAPAGDAPKGRRNGCGMHDPVGRRLFVYGGTSDGKTGEKGLAVLDLEPGRETWTTLQLANPPPLRSSGFGFSTQDGDVTCAFGNDDRPYGDVAFLGYAEPPR